MSYACVRSCTLVGVEPLPVTIEVHVSPGLPATHIVGLPQSAVREARDRVRAAIVQSGFDYPQVRVVINLAPADLPKQGGRFDLPIALAVLVAHQQQLKAVALENTVCVGELGLIGEVRRVGGVLPTAAVFMQPGQRLLIPKANRGEARLGGLQTEVVMPVESLRQAVELLQAGLRAGGRADKGCELASNSVPCAIPAANTIVPTQQADTGLLPDLCDVRGQIPARRVMEIAAAGAHHVLLSGSPGTGKSMLARRLPGILPPMTRREALEAASVASVTRAGFEQRHWGVRPFRAPHHTSSGVALVGGGARPLPGEISLAHQGVLFLDELTEFPRAVLDVLREPLETGHVSVSRAAAQAEFPARFQLVAAMNPCPCGNAGDPGMSCRCTAEQVQRYQSRLSGPLLDRIDLVISLFRPASALLEGAAEGEPSAPVRARVWAARQRQIERQGCSNAELEPRELFQVVSLPRAERLWLAAACDRLSLSVRAAHRVLRVARTLADLEQQDAVEQSQLAEALSYRLVAPSYGSEYAAGAHGVRQGAMIGG